MTHTARGACNCGAVTFEIDGEPTEVYVCHCSICRRSTGSNGIAVVVVDNDRFRWLAGEEQIRTWKKPDADWQTWFCGICSSPLPGVNDAARMYVPAGLISEGGDGLRVAHHIWVDSKAAWDTIGDSGIVHAQAFNAGTKGAGTKGAGTKGAGTTSAGTKVSHKKAAD